MRIRFSTLIVFQVAVGAAYARCMWRDRGISRVAIIDFGAPVALRPPGHTSLPPMNMTYNN